jgi:hypothetical protein
MLAWEPRGGSLETKIKKENAQGIMEVWDVGKNQTCKWLATFSLVKPGTFINSSILLGTASEMIGKKLHWAKDTVTTQA